MANCSSPYVQMKSSFEIGDMYSRRTAGCSTDSLVRLDLLVHTKLTDSTGVL